MKNFGKARFKKGAKVSVHGHKGKVIKVHLSKVGWEYKIKNEAGHTNWFGPGDYVRKSK